MRRPYRWSNILLWVAMFGGVLLVSGMCAINYYFNRIEHHPFYAGCYKLWSHHALNNGEDNSLVGIKKALENGAVGVEIDINYDKTSGHFVVSHDDTVETESSLLLRDVLKEFGGYEYYLWLDFKNLDWLTNDEASLSLNTLARLLNRHTMLSRVIIESKNPRNLMIAKDVGLATSYWIVPDPNNNPLKLFLKTYKYKMWFLVGDFSVFSMNYRFYTKAFQLDFKNAPVHLFTVNRNFDQYANNTNVKVVLTDIPTFRKRYCDE